MQCGILQISSVSAVDTCSFSVTPVFASFVSRETADTVSETCGAGASSTGVGSVTGSAAASFATSGTTFSSAAGGVGVTRCAIVAKRASAAALRRALRSDFVSTDGFWNWAARLVDLPISAASSLAFFLRRAFSLGLAARSASSFTSFSYSAKACARPS